ncbi:hypothetical protein FACS1894218_1630 [Bacilli bacterium]|nr:hypothetical protein FACS1894218_1630 [Bacilli bacterium]
MRVGRKPNRNDKEVIKELKLLGILKNEANITGNTFPIYKFAFVDKVINENKFKLLDIPVICEQLGIRKSSFYNWVDRGKPKHYN